MHCEEPCDQSPYDAVDGEHDWGVIDIYHKREHCNHCPDTYLNPSQVKCPGREYQNPLIEEIYGDLR